MLEPLDRRKIPFLSRHAWELALALWATVLGAILLIKAVDPWHHTIYPILAAAARDWRSGVDPYVWAADRAGLDHFRYCPVVAIVFGPSASLPDRLGAPIWHALNAAVLLLGVYLFGRAGSPSRATGPVRRAGPPRRVLLALALLPLSLPSLNNGQPNALIAGCLLIGASAVVSKQWTCAAACLAIPVVFKVYPLAPVLLICLASPWKLGWRIAVAVGLALALPLALANPEYVTQIYRSLVSQVQADNRRAWPLESGYKDFYVLARSLGVTIPSGLYAGLQLSSALAAAGLVARGQKNGWITARTVRLALDLGCCWVMLFGPATESNTYSQLAPIVAFALVESLAESQGVWAKALVFGTCALFAAALVGVWLPSGRSLTCVFWPTGAILLLCQRLVIMGRSNEVAAGALPKFASVSPAA